MDTFGWSYDNQVKEEIQKKCGRGGYDMKGCIAKNISHVKGELVKSLQKKGRQAEHGKTIKKDIVRRRPIMTRETTSNEEL